MVETKEKKIHVVFMDIEKAYDSVLKLQVYQELKKPILKRK